MHAQKHEILARFGPDLRSALHSVAAANKVTIDDVVRAGLGRYGASRAALEAAKAVSRVSPGAFTGLTDWPEQCTFCLDVLDESATCAHCGTVACAECVTAKGCPPCLAAGRQAHERVLSTRRSNERARRFEPTSTAA